MKDSDGVAQDGNAQVGRGQSKRHGDIIARTCLALSPTTISSPASFYAVRYAGGRSSTATIEGASRSTFTGTNFTGTSQRLFSTAIAGVVIA